jgi:hypothetical protein
MTCDVLGFVAPAQGLLLQLLRQRCHQAHCSHADTVLFGGLQAAVAVAETTQKANVMHTRALADMLAALQPNPHLHMVVHASAACCGKYLVYGCSHEPLPQQVANMLATR